MTFDDISNETNNTRTDCNELTDLIVRYKTNLNYIEFLNQDKTPICTAFGSAFSNITLGPALEGETYKKEKKKIIKDLKIKTEIIKNEIDEIFKKLLIK
jgi:hypothetical protein